MSDIPRSPTGEEANIPFMEFMRKAAKAAEQEAKAKTAAIEAIEAQDAAGITDEEAEGEEEAPAEEAPAEEAPAEEAPADGMPEFDLADSDMLSRLSARAQNRESGALAGLLTKQLQDAGFDTSRESKWSGKGGYNFTYMPGEGGALGNILVENTRADSSMAKQGTGSAVVGPGSKNRAGENIFTKIMSERLAGDTQEYIEPEPLSDAYHDTALARRNAEDREADEAIQFEDAPIQVEEEPLSDAYHDTDLARRNAEDREVDEAIQFGDAVPEEEESFDMPQGTTAQAIAARPEKDREVASRYFMEGLKAAGEEDYAESIKHFLEAQKLKPHYNTLFNISRSYENMGDMENARKYFELAQEIEGDRFENVLSRPGELLESANKTKEALERSELLMKARQRFDEYLEDKLGKPPLTDEQWDQVLAKWEEDPEQMTRRLAKIKEGM